MPRVRPPIMNRRRKSARRKNTDLSAYLSASARKSDAMRDNNNSKLLFVAVGLLFIGTIVVGSAVKNRVDNRARAQRLIGRPFITTLAPNRVTLTFTTQQPVVARIEVEAPFIAQARNLSISNTPKTLHQITLQNLQSNKEYKYSIAIYDEKNIRTESESFTFRTP